MSANRAILLGIALLVAALGATVASQYPDTLEKFAEEAGLEEGEETVAAPFPGYTVDGVTSDAWSTFLAGAAGVLATFGILTLLVAIARRSSPEGAETLPHEEANDRAS